MMKIDLSLVFVAYNEKDNIAKCLLNAVDTAKKIANKYEVIAVVAGESTDGTIDIARKLSKSNKNIRLIVQDKRTPGVGVAYATGIESAKYPFVFYSDADNQFDLREITKLIAHIDNNDIVAGYRVKRADKPGRILAAGVYAVLIQALFGINEKDFDCAFRLLRKSIFDKINLRTSKGGFVAPEMIIKANIAGLRIKQIGVTHLPRTANVSTLDAGISSLPNFRIVRNHIKEMFLVWREIYRI